jgi:hypothetical protein
MPRLPGILAFTTSQIKIAKEVSTMAKRETAAITEEARSNKE